MGKNGKYTDKELIADLLSEKDDVLAFERIFYRAEREYSFVFSIKIG